MEITEPDEISSSAGRRGIFEENVVLFVSFGRGVLFLCTDIYECIWRIGVETDTSQQLHDKSPD